jgi:SagB-type dehydrogenase family enzyme
MLKITMSSVNYVADIKAPDRPTPFTRLMVFVNRIEGLSSGTYVYHAAEHELEVVQTQDLSLFLQSQYKLENYNLESAAAVVAIVGNPKAMLAAFGNRGFRILNAEVGYLIQTMYLVASGMSTGCGAALGFDNAAMNEKLGLAESDWKAISFVIMGPRQPEEASFDARLS